MLRNSSQNSGKNIWRQESPVLAIGYFKGISLVEIILRCECLHIMLLVVKMFCSWNGMGRPMLSCSLLGKFELIKMHKFSLENNLPNSDLPDLD
jgi:hypothetical protein